MSPRDPVLLCAADDAYALPLAVALHSAVRHLDPSRRLTLYLLDGGISPRMERRVLRGLPSDRVRVLPVRPDLALPREIAVEGYASPAVYLRLLAPQLLPDEERVLYLDSDVLVRRDLGELWDVPMQGRPLLAVQDQGMPFVDNRVALPRFEAARPYLWGERAVPNWEELGLDPRAPYLNSGVLVMDLAAWRREDASRELLEVVRRHPAHARLPDQYALNVVFAGRWGALDLRWNANPGLHRFPSAEACPFDEAVWRAALEDPWIVHFVGPVKPWTWDGAIAWKALFQQEVDRLAWPRWTHARWTLWPWLRRRALRWSRPWRRRGRRLRASAARSRRRARALVRRAAGRSPAP